MRRFCAATLFLLTLGSISATEVRVGAPVPDWSLVDAEGNEWSSRSLLGNVVVLEFWATWCPNCQRNMPEVARLARDYAEAPVKVLAVNISENADAVAYLDQHGIDVDLALEGDDVAESFGVTGTPAVVVIDPEGRLAMQTVGANDERNRQLRQTVDRMLNSGVRESRRR